MCTPGITDRDEKQISRTHCRVTAHYGLINQRSAQLFFLLLLGCLRAALLDAGQGEFAEKGFLGARVDAIAPRAGVNKQLILLFAKRFTGLDPRSPEFRDRATQQLVAIVTRLA